MARSRIDPYWIERIRQLTERRGGSTTITAQLKAEAKREGREKPPSEKTVRTYIKEHHAAPEHERRLYRQVYWPESFINNPDLPWEAAPVVLEAMRACEDKKEDRPTVRTAKWLWRLALATPYMAASDQPGWARDRLDWARILAACEASGLPKAEETWRWMEWRLLHPEVEPPKPFPIWTTIDAAEAEGAFSPAVAEGFRESKRRRKMEKEGQE